MALIKAEISLVHVPEIKCWTFSDVIDALFGIRQFYYSPVCHGLGVIKVQALARSDG